MIRYGDKNQQMHTNILEYRILYYKRSKTLTYKCRKFSSFTMFIM